MYSTSWGANETLISRKAAKQRSKEFIITRVQFEQTTVTYVLMIYIYMKLYCLNWNLFHSFISENKCSEICSDRSIAQCTHISAIFSSKK